MIRRFLVWLRNFIDSLLQKTSKHPQYTIYGNTATVNTYDLFLTAGSPNTFCNNTITNSDTGIWLSNSNSEWDYYG